MGTQKKQTKRAGKSPAYTTMASAYIIAVMAVAVIVATAGIWWGVSQHHAKAAATCVALKVPVALAEGKAADQTITGEYCQPTTWATGTHQIDVLTPGAGYNHNYFDWPMQSDNYSYVEKTLDAGRATFAYDRLGTGQSSHPASTAVTFDADVYALHQIIQTFRLTGYKEVNAIGHSYGSGVTVQEAGLYNDASRVVATGFIHEIRNPVVATIHYPAKQDPAFAHDNFDPGYLVSKPGSRKQVFYASSADKAVIDYDEAHRDLISGVAFGGYIASKQTPKTANVSTKITEPVLLVVGEKDFLFCDDIKVLDCASTSAIKTLEEPYYPKAKSLTIKTVPDTGHDLTLHRSADQSFDDINAWVKSH